MKTLSTLFLMLTTAVGLASAQSGDYPIAFPKDQDRTYSNRVLSSIGLGACKATVANTAKMYCDMTHRSLVAKAGETVQPIFGFSTDWMHSYAYIDKNKNGQFDVSKPGQSRTTHGAKRVGGVFRPENGRRPLLQQRRRDGSLLDASVTDLHRSVVDEAGLLYDALQGRLGLLRPRRTRR